MNTTIGPHWSWEDVAINKCVVTRVGVWRQHNTGGLSVCGGRTYSPDLVCTILTGALSLV